MRPGVLSRDCEGADSARLLTRAARDAAWARRPCYGRHAGFTVLEMLIAASIALLVFGIGFVTINGTIRARSEAESQIRAAENARLFFQLLERDWAAAYPGPTEPPGTYAKMIKGNTPMPGATNPATIAIEDQVPDINAFNTIGSDIIQFYTHADMNPASTTANPDRLVFVRYYVNPVDHTLCRQVLDDATHVPFEQNQSVAVKPYATSDGNAMFDDVRQLVILHRTWRPDTKDFDPALYSTVDSSNYASSTHLVVKLIMRDKYAEERLKHDPLATQQMLFRSFVRVLPIPKTFE